MNVKCFTGVVCCFVVCVFLAGCAPTAFKVTPVPITEKLDESTVKADAGIFLPKIALVDIDGILANQRKSGLLGEEENPMALAVEKLEKAAKDNAVKAVVLRINSPGGSVTASDILYRQILKVRQGSDKHPGKPVIAMLMDVGASGGYYIACAADEIVAEPTAITGSIGVIMLNLNVKSLMEKIGVQTDAIKSGTNKDAGSIFRPLTPDERKIFQTLIDEFYGRFVDVVAKARTKLPRDKILELADGRVYSGEQAQKNGLVDQAGGLDLAIERAKELSKTPAARLVMYSRPGGYRATVYAKTNPPSAQVQQYNLFNFTMPGALEAQQDYFMYLWQP